MHSSRRSHVFLPSPPSLLPSWTLANLTLYSTEKLARTETAFDRLHREEEEAVRDAVLLSTQQPLPAQPQAQLPPAIPPPPTHYPTLHGTLSNSTFPATSTTINRSSSSLAPIHASTSSSAPHPPAALVTNSTSTTDGIASFSTLHHPTPVGVFPSVSTSDIQSFSDASLQRKPVGFPQPRKMEEPQRVQVVEDEDLVLADSEGEPEQGALLTSFCAGSGS